MKRTTAFLGADPDQPERSSERSSEQSTANGPLLLPGQDTYDIPASTPDPTAPDAEGRTWFNVGVRKIDPPDRDIAREVFSSDSAIEGRFYNVMGADDRDLESYPVGSNACYAARLTPAEAGRFAAASNLRFLEPLRRYKQFEAAVESEMV